MEKYQITQLYKSGPESLGLSKPGMNGPFFEGGGGKMALLPLDIGSVLCYSHLMRKTFQYRLFPTKKHIKALQDTLEECRWL